MGRRARDRLSTEILHLQFVAYRTSKTLSDLETNQKLAYYILSTFIDINYEY